MNLLDIKLEAFICTCIVHFHSNEPSFHSWYSPVSSTTQNVIIVKAIGKDIDVDDGMGISSAISMSNTRNSTAKMKNRKENGIRAEL